MRLKPRSEAVDNRKQQQRMVSPCQERVHVEISSKNYTLPHPFLLVPLTHSTTPTPTMAATIRMVTRAMGRTMAKAW